MSESLASSDKLSFVENFLLSGAAAIASKTIAAPIERVKLMVQNQGEMIKAGVLKEEYRGVLDCTIRTFRSEGLAAFWRGNMANVVRYFPTQALNFAFKDKVKSMFKVQKNETNAMKFAKNIAAGGAAGALSLSFVYSLDYARTRLASDLKSASGERQYNGLFDVYKKSYKTDGIAGLYRGFVISCVGIIVYRGFYFGLYDTLRPMLLGKDASAFTSFILAYGVTVVSGLLSYPLDTVRRRMMMTVGAASKYKNSLDCFGQIIKNEGPAALMKGAGANILRGVAGAGVLAGFDAFQKWYVNFKVANQTKA